MKRYEIALVEDLGTYYKVNGLSYNTLDFIPTENESYVNLSYNAYKFIDEAIRKDKIIRILKPLKGNEVLIEDIQIVDNNLSELEIIKNAAFMRFKSKVTPVMTKESGLVLYDFIMANNELASKGYFITDSNREEKYIEIVETDDENLISELELFLECKDKLERASFLKKQTKELKKDLEKCKNVDEVQELTNKYIKNTFFNTL